MPEKPPETCPLCGVAHHTWQAHSFRRSVPAPKSPASPAPQAEVVPVVVRTIPRAEPVKRGRPKVYADHAARQRAYYQRAKTEKRARPR
jgi:hypothetical protein